MDKVNPKKLEPVSPIKVLAGLKLNGKKPANAPANAVIMIIAINGDSFKEKIINNEIQDIIVIPEDSPSNPSIRLMAFVIPTIHPIVNIIEKASLISIDGKKGNSKSPKRNPNATTIIAANN